MACRVCIPHLISQACTVLHSEGLYERRVHAFIPPAFLPFALHSQPVNRAGGLICIS